MRVAFVVVFGVTGFLLGREAYFSVFSPHFASETMQLIFLVGSPVVGAVLALRHFRYNPLHFATPTSLIPARLQ